MEQVLNLAWLLAVAGVLLVVARDPRRTQRPAHTVVVVLACVSLLLFPVISASDDLHAASDISGRAAWDHEKRSLATMVGFVISHWFDPPLAMTGYFQSPAVLGSALSGHFRLQDSRGPPRLCGTAHRSGNIS